MTLEAPQGTERAARLPSVLEVIYLIFNQGYAAIAGDDLVRPSVATSAKRVLEDGKAFSGRRVLPLGWRDLATDPGSCPVVQRPLTGTGSAGDGPVET